MSDKDLLINETSTRSETGTQSETGTKTAVALHYDHVDAPRVVAKGEGVIAEQIIAAAKEHGVFIKENPLLAEALGAVELDDEIPVELYMAVAEIIGFVLSVKGQAVPAVSEQR